jgi:hypothetical protein
MNAKNLKITVEMRKKDTYSKIETFFHLLCTAAANILQFSQQ